MSSLIHESNQLYILNENCLSLTTVLADKKVKQRADLILN